MAKLREIAESLLSTTTVSFATAPAATTLYTVPTGKRCVLTKAVVIAAGDAGATTITIGKVGALADFLNTQNLGNVNAQYDAAILQPVPNATPVLQKSYAAGDVIQLDMTSNALGAAGNTVKLFGFLY